MLGNTIVTQGATKLLKRMLLCALTYSIFGSVPSFCKDVGKWHLEITQKQPSGNPHIMRPPAMGTTDDRSTDSPGNYGPTVITIPPDQALHHLQNGPLNCQSGGGGNGCDFIDFVNLTDLGTGRVQYTARNHGGRSVFTLGIWTQDLAPLVTETPEQVWVEGKNFVVQIPNGASAIVIGSFDGSAVVFSPSDPLSAEDGKRFQLIRKIDGATQTTYLFKVLEIDKQAVLSKDKKSRLQNPNEKGL